MKITFKHVIHGDKITYEHLEQLTAQDIRVYTDKALRFIAQQTRMKINSKNVSVTITEE
jgi:hypothetical protein